MNERVIKAIALTAEVLGQKLSDPAKIAFARLLEGYDENLVVTALKQCMMEVKGRFTPAEVLQRIDDGRPTANEAWASIRWNENETMIVTSETMNAWANSAQLHEIDVVAARMAFIDSYNAMCVLNRMDRVKVRWVVSIGYDVEHRKTAIWEALQLKRITKSEATRYIGEHNTPVSSTKMIERGASPIPDDVKIKMSILMAAKDAPRR